MCQKASFPYLPVQPQLLSCVLTTQHSLQHSVPTDEYIHAQTTLMKNILAQFVSLIRMEIHASISIYIMYTYLHTTQLHTIFHARVQCIHPRTAHMN